MISATSSSVGLGGLETGHLRPHLETELARFPRADVLARPEVEEGHHAHALEHGEGAERPALAGPLGVVTRRRRQRDLGQPRPLMPEADPPLFVEVQGERRGLVDRQVDRDFARQDEAIAGVGVARRFEPRTARHRPMHAGRIAHAGADQQALEVERIDRLPFKIVGRQHATVLLLDSFYFTASSNIAEVVAHVEYSLP